MVTSIRSRVDQAWVEAFRKALSEPVTEEEKARRRAITRQVLAFRDSLPSIAPDTTEQYIRETRDEEDARP